MLYTNQLQWQMKMVKLTLLLALLGWGNLGTAGVPRSVSLAFKQEALDLDTGSVMAVNSGDIVTEVDETATLDYTPLGTSTGSLPPANRRNAAGQGDTTPSLPEGLSQADWSYIQGLIEADLYQVTPQTTETKLDTPATYHARNTAHRLQTIFGPEGIRVRPLGPRQPEWEWGLTLLSYGYAGALKPVPSAQPVANGMRLEYRRGPLVEWYVNDKRGIEQGFTLTEPPPGTPNQRPLTVQLATVGALTTAVTSDGKALQVRDASGTPVLRYEGLTAWDAEGRTLPTRMVAKARTIALEVDDREATYPIVIDPTIVTEDAKLLASDGALEHLFGKSVAISGNTVVVGASYYHDTADVAGIAAYIFTHSGTRWTQQAKLRVSDDATNNGFGISVAISGDTVVVGAYQEEATHVFTRNGTRWTEQAKLLASDGGSSDRFGQSVAISGDTVVVGAPADDSEFSPDIRGTGSAYVFVEPAGGWASSTPLTEDVKLVASDADTGALFGWSLAISGDTVVVGAWGDANNGNNTPYMGSAYVFVEPAGGWASAAPYPLYEHTKLLASDRRAHLHFGQSVAVSGDTVVVGAPPHSSAYVFVEPVEGWSSTTHLNEDAKLRASDGTSGNNFGYSVAISGETVVVGVPADSDNGFHSGAVYIFTRNGTTWTEQTKLRASDSAAYDFLGESVAVSGETVVVGAWGDDNDNGPEGGAAYVFSLVSNINTLPTANAGENLAITDEQECETVIKGVASDVDNDSGLYRWLEGETEVLTWGPIGANGEAYLDLCTVSSLGLGQHTLTLEVNDGKTSSSDDMILTIDNSAPHAAPTGGGVYPLGALITLGGQVFDFDGDLLTYSWSEKTNTYCSGEIQGVEGGEPISLPQCDLLDLELGIHTVTLTISDGINDPVSRNITIKLVDTIAPTVAPKSNVSILWPPNHEMVDITIHANASDNSSRPPTLSVAITSNEPQQGLGDGDMTPDWTSPMIDQATGTITLQLRAERSSLRGNRNYIISITAIDDAGNSSIVDMEIIVPHDQRDKSQAALGLPRHTHTHTLSC